MYWTTTSLKTLHVMKSSHPRAGSIAAVVMMAIQSFPETTIKRIHLQTWPYCLNKEMQKQAQVCQSSSTPKVEGGAEVHTRVEFTDSQVDVYLLLTSLFSMIKLTC